MKSQFQTLTFLSSYNFKSQNDEDLINGLISKQLQISSKQLRTSAEYSEDGLDSETFKRWYESGYATFQIVRHNDRTVMLGNVTADEYRVIGSLQFDESGTKKIVKENFSVQPEEITGATDSQVEEFKDKLMECDLQPDFTTLELCPKYIPKLTERVAYCDFSQGLQGVGAVKNISPEGEVTFYCYFRYPTAENEKEIGYNTNERPGINVRDCVFDSVDTENITTILGNSTSCVRRLRRELEKVGKVWRDKTLRVEPLEMEVGEGQRYYYISDKFKVSVDIDKKTPVSRARFLSGNYFISQEAAASALSHLQGFVRDYLASPNWPEVEGKGSAEE